MKTVGVIGAGQMGAGIAQVSAQAGQVDRSRVPDRSATRDTSPEERQARAAETLWRVTCASCHGHQGRGDGPGRMPGVSMPDMTTTAWQTSQTDEAIALVIRQGRGTMPAFGERLAPAAIAQLVGHIRRFTPSAEQ